MNNIVSGWSTEDGVKQASEPEKWPEVEVPGQAKHTKNNGSSDLWPHW